MKNNFSFILYSTKNYENYFLIKIFNYYNFSFPNLIFLYLYLSFIQNEV